MRIDKLLCDTMFITRNEAKTYIKNGKVIINDKIIKDSGFHVAPHKDVIVCNGKALSYEEFVYYMLNKPAGVVSATTDSKDKTVIDLFKDEGRNDLFPVGRLDKDTVGILIVTNDGALSHHLTSPRHHVDKEYFVGCKKPVSKEDISKLEKGVELIGDGFTKEAKVNIISDTEIILTISEGMYHQVKRMMAAVDNEVIYLKRLSIGGVKLDENLEEGCYRRLSLEELNLLKEKEE